MVAVDNPEQDPRGEDKCRQPQCPTTVAPFPAEIPVGQGQRAEQ